MSKCLLFPNSTKYLIPGILFIILPCTPNEPPSPNVKEPLIAANITLRQASVGTHFVHHIIVYHNMVKTSYNHSFNDGNVKRLMCIDENAYNMDFLSPHKRMRHSHDIHPDSNSNDLMKLLTRDNGTCSTPKHTTTPKRKKRSEMTPKASPITQPPLIFSIGTQDNQQNRMAHNFFQSSNKIDVAKVANSVPSSIVISSKKSIKHADTRKENVNDWNNDLSQTKLLMSPTPDSTMMVPSYPNESYRKEASQPTKLILFIQNQNWNKVKQRCSSHPQEASVWFTKRSDSKKEVYSRDLPIHIACSSISSHAIPKDTLEALIMAYPEGLVSMTDDGDKCPLHMVSEISSSSVRHDMVSVILKANPHVAKLKSRSGDLPLHIACRHQNLLLETVQLLINAYPESVLVTGEMERLALQIASNSGARLSIIKLLLSSNIDAIYWKDSFDALPLHLACKNGTSEEVCLLLLSEYQHASHIGDCWDKLPLHYVCESCMSEALVKTLLLKFPESVYAKDSTGQTPVDLAACSSSKKKDKIIQILQYHKGQLEKKKSITGGHRNDSSFYAKATTDTDFNARMQQEINDVRSELSDVKGMLNQIIIFMGNKNANGETV